MDIGLDAPNTPKEKFTYTPKELAQLLSISKATVYRLVNQRQIRSHKLKGVLRFKRSDIDEFLKANCIEPMR